MKTLIFGNYGAGNFGDELVLKGILYLLRDKDVHVLSTNPKETEKLHNVKSGWVFPTGLKSLLRGTIFRTLKCYREADEIIFGGGTLFTDEESKTIWISGLQILPAILMRKKIICYRQGIGPIKHKRIVRWIFNHFDTIEVRDKQSAEELKKIGVKKTIEIKPDPVFELPTKKAHGSELLISLRQWPNLDPKFAEKISQFIEATGLSARFLAFGSSDAKLAQQLNLNPTQVTLDNYDEIFSHGAFVLAMRLHANILAMLYEIPCISLAYESKIKNLFRDRGLDEYAINIKDIDLTELEAKFNRLREAKSA